MVYTKILHKKSTVCKFQKSNLYIQKVYKQKLEKF